MDGISPLYKNLCTMLIYFQGFTVKQMVNPWKTYVKLSVVLMGSHGLTKGSLAGTAHVQIHKEANTSPNLSVIGVVMVTGALVMDLFWGNLQAAIFAVNLETTQMEMLFCSTVVGLPSLIPPVILTGELFYGLEFLFSGKRTNLCCYIRQKRDFMWDLSENGFGFSYWCEAKSHIA